ncbi:MAG: hypothetical protein ABSF36_03455 [Candidatus Methanomethylicaceae archaeon]|jgi:tetratricopeptide (TPR) repeat protein
MALDQRRTAYGYYEKALAYKEAGDFISALNEIKLAISYAPCSNTYKDAREEIERSLDPAALSEKILANIKSGNFTVALKCAESLTCQYPDKRSTLSEKASEANKGDTGRQPFPSFLVPSAEGYARGKNFGFAMMLVAEAITLDPNNQSLARQLEELANYHRAQLLAEEAKKLYPDSIDQAISTMEGAVKLSPNDAEYRSSLAKMIGERPVIFYSLAKRLYGQKRLEEATRAISKALEFSPKNTAFQNLQISVQKAIAENEKNEEKKEFKRSVSRYE